MAILHLTGFLSRIHHTVSITVMSEQVGSDWGAGWNPQQNPSYRESFAAIPEQVKSNWGSGPNSQQDPSYTKSLAASSLLPSGNENLSRHKSDSGSASVSLSKQKWTCIVRILVPLTSLDIDWDLHQACHNCQSAKHGCSGESPCSRCQSENLICTFTPAKYDCLFFTTSLPLWSLITENRWFIPDCYNIWIILSRNCYNSWIILSELSKVCRKSNSRTSKTSRNCNNFWNTYRNLYSKMSRTRRNYNNFWIIRTEQSAEIVAQRNKQLLTISNQNSMTIMNVKRLLLCALQRH